MRFDASPSVQQLVRKTIAIDPRMVRCGVVKMGGKLKDIVDVKGAVEWQRRRKDSLALLGPSTRGDVGALGEGHGLTDLSKYR